MRTLLLVSSHAAVLAAGFALGVYFLPILAAPPAPLASEVQKAGEGARYSAEFRRDLRGSDALHWGEGRLAIGPTQVAFLGNLAPGPAYRLYLVPKFVETEAQFLAHKVRSVPVADIRTFENFIAPLPAGARLEEHEALVIWCESFSQFITAAKYR